MQGRPLTYHALLDRQRQSHGLTYQQLAERAWTTGSYVHRLCRGDARPGHTIVLGRDWHRLRHGSFGSRRQGCYNPGIGGSVRQ
jgi:hypothetical protein